MMLLSGLFLVHVLFMNMANCRMFRSATLTHMRQLATMIHVKH
jgi:hypothetical protein